MKIDHFTRKRMEKLIKKIEQTNMDQKLHDQFTSKEIDDFEQELTGFEVNTILTIALDPQSIRQYVVKILKDMLEVM